MTPAQQTALEGLVGRSLTPFEQADIDAFLPDRNDVAIAAILSVGRVKSVPMRIGIGTILAVLAPNGGEFLNTLETIGQADANIKWVLKLIEQSNFDIGLPATRAQMQAFAVQVTTLADPLAALLAVAEQADPVAVSAVSAALNLAEGRMTL